MDVEEKMKVLGEARGRNRLQQAQARGLSSTLGGGRRLTDAVIPLLAEAIDVAVDPKGAGRRAKALPYLRMLPSEVLAYITARSTFDNLARVGPLTAFAYTLGRRAEDEARFRQWLKDNPRYARKVQQQVEGSNDYRYKHRVMVHAMNRDEAASTWEEWSAEAKRSVGLKLVDLLMQSTGLFQLKHHSTDTKKTQLHLSPTEECLELVTKGDQRELLRPWYLPMTEVPVDWTRVWNGGYREHPLMLVKGRNRDYYRQLARADMPLVYESINRLQHTAWRVNRDVLEVFDLLWERGLEVAGLPPQEDRPLPEKLDWMTAHSELPKDERPELDEWQHLELRAWKQAASRIHVGNARRESKVIAAAKIREVALMFKDTERIYFPYQLDWRGRAYAVPLFLQPQGSDMARGLLEFAEAKPFGSQEAVGWWLIHGANCWGEDKLPFEDRKQWVRDHEEEILAVAEDPVAELWWADADEPWQFLGFCLEYGRWCAGGCGVDFVSHLPVSMDGSCNGLQHLSAMMRDQVGAQATNLLPSERPQDIYATVCQEVERRVAKDAHQVVLANGEIKGLGLRIEGDSPPNPLARQWLQSGLLTRDVVKRQVMTRPYGATKRGMLDQLDSHLRKVADKRGGVLPFEDSTGWEARQYLSPIVWDSINVVVHGAQVCMEWLQKCAGIVAKRDLPLRWVTPTGFPVEQSYPSKKPRLIKTVLLGQRYRLTVRDSHPTKLDKRKQQAGVSPNVVHSMDAAHMMLTMHALGDQVKSWVMVHDSFGAHAADAPALARALRSTFVDLYSEDRLEQWRQQVHQGTGLDLPPVPERGDLDLEKVREAMFFFA